MAATVSELVFTCTPSPLFDLPKTPLGFFPEILGDLLTLVTAAKVSDSVSHERKRHWPLQLSASRQ
jgi:hypothetical protein